MNYTYMEIALILLILIIGIVLYMTLTIPFFVKDIGDKGHNYGIFKRFKTDYIAYGGRYDCEHFAKCLIEKKRNFVIKNTRKTKRWYSIQDLGYKILVHQDNLKYFKNS